MMAPTQPIVQDLRSSGLPEVLTEAQIRPTMDKQDHDLSSLWCEALYRRLSRGLSELHTKYV